MARGRLGRLATLAGAAMLLATSCAKNAPQDTLKPQGPEARTIADLINPVFGVAAIVFVLVLGGALFVAVKFRARGDEDFDEFPAQVHGNFKLEIGWTIVPAIILLVIGAFTVSTIFTLAKKPDATALHVRVTGQQWWWEYRYDLNGDGKFDEIITANDLVIPEGRQVALSITSRDVIHSWWSPRLNGKKDAVPNHVSPLNIQADKPGEYIGQCTEYCGLSHAQMRIKVVAMTAGDFTKWAEDQQKPASNPTDQLAVDGWKVFAGQCSSCHRINGLKDPSKVTTAADASKATKDFTYPKTVNQQAGVVPNLTHLMSRSTFAGAMFDLRKPTAECKALGEFWASDPKNLTKCLNRADLEAWLLDPPGRKPMAPGAAMSPKSRGMPNLNLTGQQIDQLVAYLTTLK
ncbi:MAG: cytochrome c oxidase subunit 2 [Acidimicrobiales bacterium]|nr:cytochrome c oxidase subunit 2 [Acidimicrobiales bacterium]